jgi:hypothetical protein
LPVIEQIMDPKEVQKAREDSRLIGVDVSEQLDYELGRFRCFRRRIKNSSASSPCKFECAGKSVGLDLEQSIQPSPESPD